MPIDATHVGRRYPATPPHEITQAEIDAFAHALGAPGGPVAPVTFAMRVAAPAWSALFADPELGLALARTVHADQAFDVTRPLQAGDVVTAAMRIERVRSRGEQDFVTVAVDVLVGETVAVVSTSTFVCTREQVAA